MPEKTRWEAGMRQVTWTLSATDTGGTRLRLEHTGFLPTNTFAAKGAERGSRGGRCVTEKC